MNRSKRLKSDRSVVVREHKVLPLFSTAPVSSANANAKVGIKIPPKPPLKAMTQRRQRESCGDGHSTRWGRAKMVFPKWVDSVLSSVFRNKKSSIDGMVFSESGSDDGVYGSEDGFSVLEDKKEDHEGGLELCKLRILMGLKCRPLSSSGTLRYDADGVLLPDPDLDP